jgi:hypothetical protein
MKEKAHVKLWLKDSQKKSDRHWEFTYFGEKRDVLIQRIGYLEYWCESWEDAITSFDPDEVVHIEIEADFRGKVKKFYDDHRVPKGGSVERFQE